MNLDSNRVSGRRPWTSPELVIETIENTRQPKAPSAPERVVSGVPAGPPS